MFGSLRKIGVYIFIFSVLLSIGLKYINMDQYIRIALSTFGIGTGVVFMMFGSNLIPK
ncbi:hypothetical protein [Helicovermis profundi]|uniref:Uncharacterized protein n=1 Tax=Helicovermis profundi TaxID=3065157 RepID=A0AAU9EMH9_9FIRM|nr:hypothetical protein HLPR_08070 [Clostridia bacterium S502]